MGILDAPAISKLRAADVDVLAEAQLGTGNTDFTVPTGKGWTIVSGSICNTTATAVTVTLSVLKTSGGTARRVLSAYPLAANDTLDLRAYLPGVLPAGAIVRATAGTATAVDFVITGTVLG